MADGPWNDPLVAGTAVAPAAATTVKGPWNDPMVNGISPAPAPKDEAAPSEPQMEGAWREPALAASNLAKGGIAGLTAPLDLAASSDDRMMASLKNLWHVIKGEPRQPISTDMGAGIMRAALGASQQAGITDRPDLQPQGAGERYLAAGSQGVGAAIPMALAGGGGAGPIMMNLARGGTGGMGAQAGADLFPDSKIAPFVGGVLGSGVPDALRIGGSAVLRGGQAVLRGGQNALGLYNPSDRADQIIARKFSEDKINPQELAQTIQQNPDKPLTLTDLAGPATQRMARASLDQPSEGSAQASQMLQERDLGVGQRGPFDLFKTGGASDRTIAAVKTALGSEDAFKTAEDIVAQRKAASDPLYAAFRAEHPIPADKVAPFMSSPTFKAAVGRANKAILDEGGSPMSDVFTFEKNPLDRFGADIPVTIKGGAFPPDTLDRIKQGIDDVYMAAKRSGDAGEIRTANSLRSRYLNFLDNQYPDTYSKARLAYAGPSASLDAIKTGAEVFKTSPEEMEAAISKAAPEDRPLIRLGAQQALVSKIENTKDGRNEILGMLGSPAQRKQVAALFETPEQLDQFAQNIGLENRMFGVKNLGAGSRTLPSAMDQAELSGAGLEGIETAAHAVGGNWKGALVRAARPLINRMGEGANRDTTSLLAQRLLNPNAAANLDQLQSIQGILNLDQLQSIQGILSGASAPARLGRLPGVYGGLTAGLLRGQ